MFCLESDRGAEGRHTNLANLCQLLCVMFSRIRARENVSFSFQHCCSMMLEVYQICLSAGALPVELTTLSRLVNYRGGHPSLFPIPSTPSAVSALRLRAFRSRCPVFRLPDLATLSTYLFAYYSISAVLCSRKVHSVLCAPDTATSWSAVVQPYV